MRKNYLLRQRYNRIVAIVMFLICNTNLYSQTTYVLSFTDKFLNESNPTVVKPHPSKVQRLNSSNRGTIICMYDPNYNIPDSMKSCINVAAQTWESYLNNEDTIYIQFSMENLDGYDIQTDVVYYAGANENMIYPYSLARNKKKVSGVLLQGYDAIIVINSNTKWNCSFNDKIIPFSKNLTTAILRGISTAMGFGTSVKEKRGVIQFFAPLKYSVFDNLVISKSKQRLSSMVDNPDLKTFVTSDLYVLDETSPDYQLYTPNPFESYSSLRYFKKEGSLMSYGLKTGEKVQQIDNNTIQVLKEMGWKHNEPTTIKIIGEGISETGIASAYESHYFYIQNNTGYSINSPNWTFELPLNNGEQIILSQSNSPTFTISPLTNTDQYKKNIDGDINGIITFTATVNGNKVVQIYNLTLEVKPAIYFVSDPVYTYRSSDHSYFADFTIRYGGARYLTIGTEEDYVSGYHVQDIFEPYQTHVRVGPFSDYHDAWVDLTVENQYGEATQTVELHKLVKSIIPGFDKTDYTNIVNTKLFDLNGNLIKEYYITDKVDRFSLPKGFYIQKSYKNEECIKTEKIIL